MKFQNLCICRHLMYIDFAHSETPDRSENEQIYQVTILPGPMVSHNFNKERYVELYL